MFLSFLLTIYPQHALNSAEDKEGPTGCWAKTTEAWCWYLAVEEGEIRFRVILLTCGCTDGVADSQACRMDEPCFFECGGLPCCDIQNGIKKVAEKSRRMLTITNHIPLPIIHCSSPLCSFKFRGKKKKKKDFAQFLPFHLWRGLISTANQRPG